jgi:hypothetical protein
VSADGALAWMMAPLSGAATHSIEPWAYWHARLMVLAWGLLVPLGALSARYFKVLPRQRWPQQLDSQPWWRAHRWLQWGGVLAMSAGVALAWWQAPASRASGAGSQCPPVHATLGLGAFVGLAWTAGSWRGWPAAARAVPTDRAAARRPLRHDAAPRVWFEHVHKALGWLAVLAAGRSP